MPNAKLILQSYQLGLLPIKLSFGLVITSFILYVIYKFGILKGGIVMTAISFVLSILTLKSYDWSKRDWLGIEAVKSLKGYGGDKKLGKMTAWVIKKKPIDNLSFSFNKI